MSGQRYASPGPSGFYTPTHNVQANVDPLRKALLLFVQDERRMLGRQLEDTALAHKIVIQALEETLVSTFCFGK